MSTASQPRANPDRALAVFFVAAGQAVRGTVLTGAVLLALFAADVRVTRHVSAGDVAGVIFAALAVAGGLIYLHPPGRGRRAVRAHGPRLPHPAGPAPALNPRTEENDMTPDPCSTPADRAWDEVLADAVRVLTEAARLRRPVMRRGDDGEWEPDPLQTEPADWAEFVTLAVAGAAANVGSIDRALEGRPGSWEADAVRGMLLSTVGEDPAELLRHRTEPIRVVLRPAELLQDLGYGVLYEESRRFLRAEQDRHLWRYRLGDDRAWTPLDDGAPAWADAFDEGVDADTVWPESTPPGTVTTVPRSAEDEAAWNVLLDQEGALEDLEYEQDPRAYGEALKATVLAEAARMYPGVGVEVTIDIDERTWRDDSPYWGATPEEKLVDAAAGKTPLPWSVIAPGDCPPGQSVADVERGGGRLPHMRLAQAPQEDRTAPEGDATPSGRTYTHPDVFTTGVTEGWAEAETDPARIDWTERQARAAIPFEVIDGRPVNPCEKTGIRYGRNEMGFWGEQLMADALVTVTLNHTGIRYLLMVERGDGYGWAVPGGHVEPGETGLQAGVRELAEETGLDARGWPFTVFREMPPRYVPDPRSSDEAWAVTIPVHVDLGNRDEAPAVNGGDDARRAEWIPAGSYEQLRRDLDRHFGRRVFAAHVDMLREFLGTEAHDAEG